MKTSTDTKQIIGAMLKAQKDITNAIMDGNNPHFKSKYATLESVIDSIKEPLEKNGLLVRQTMNLENTLITTVYHESGEFMQSEVKLMLGRQDMQQLGSAITYARRYSLAAMFNITQEDDDGNAAKDDGKKSKSQQIDDLKNKNNKPEQLGKHIDEVNKVQALLENPSEFVFPVGKFLGKKLIEMSVEDIDKNVDYWSKQKKKGSIPPKLEEFLVNAYAYLEQKGFYPPSKG